MDYFKREEVLIIEYSECPNEMRIKIRDHYDYRFHNDIILEHTSEFKPNYRTEETYGDTLSMSSIERYWKDQTNTNGFKGTLEDFIEKYGLEIDKWLIETGYDFKGIKRIFFAICW